MYACTCLNLTFLTIKLYDKEGDVQCSPATTPP